MPLPALTPLVSLGLLVGLVLGPVTPAIATVAEAEFSPAHTQQLVGLDDFSYDSDWFPKDAPLQLRLVVHAGNSVAIAMPGSGRYDWEAAAIDFVGETDAGIFAVDVGMLLEAKVRFDVGGITWESDLLGPFDYAVIAATAFTPYLLAGNPERPAVISDTTTPVTVVSVPITPDIVVASGNLEIDVSLIIDAALAGEAIEVATLEPEVQWQVIEDEGAAAPLSAGSGPLPDPFLVDGVLRCHVETAPTIVLRPTLVMKILGIKYEVAGIDLPVALPPFDDRLALGTESMAFDRPPPPPEPSGTSGGESASGGESESDGASAGSDGGSGDPSDSATSGAADGDTTNENEDYDGCGCRSPGPTRGGAPWLGLGLLFVVTARRRTWSPGART